MYFELLQNALPEYLKIRSELELKDCTVKYGFQGDMEYECLDDYGIKKGHRPGYLMTNTMTLVGNYEGDLFEDEPIFDGYRKDSVDTNGVVDTERLLEYATSALGRNFTDLNPSSYVARVLGNKNCVSLLYNLLRMYYILENSNLKYDENKPYYDNGHVYIRNKDLFGSASEETVNFNDCVSFEQWCYIKSAGNCVGIDEDAVVMNWPGRMNLVSSSIIAKAAGSWLREAPISICHTSPRLTDMIYFRTNIDDGTVERFSKYEVSKVISNLVEANKLYTDFDIAYGMLMQVLFNPVPRVAESAVWFKEKQVVQMPVLHCGLGLCPALTSGDVYTRDDSWQVTYRSWLSGTAAAYYHSMLYNEEVFLALSDFGRAGNKSISDFKALGRLLTAGMNVGYFGLLSDLLLLCTRRQADIRVMSPTTAGVNRDISALQERQIDLPIIVKDTNVREFYNIAGLTTVRLKLGDKAMLSVLCVTPSVYPIFTYGLQPDELFGDTFEGSINYETVGPDKQLVFVDPLDFTKFMNISRMMGNDVVATELYSGSKVRNFADNGCGRFIYTDLQLGNKVRFHIENSDIRLRRYNWLNIKDCVGSVTLKYKISDFRAKFINGNKDLKVAGNVVINRNVTMLDSVKEFLNNSNNNMLHPLKKIVKTDFRFLEYKTPDTWGNTIPSLPRRIITDVDPEDAEPLNQEPLPDIEDVLQD